MKTKLIIGLAGVILLLLTVLSLTYERLQFTKLEKVRYETNYEAMKQQETSKALVERVIKKEFKAMFPELKKIAEQSGIKVKNIETIHNVTHRTVWDTVPVEVDLVTDPLDDQKLSFLEKRNCIDVEGFIDFNESTIELTKENQPGIDLIFDRVESNDTLTTFFFWERKLKKFLFIKIRLGKKQYWAESFSSCKAELKTQAIQLTKKGK